MERLWEVLTGDYPPSLPREIPLLTSLCYYALTVVLGRQLRRAVRHAAPVALRPYVLDLVTAFQLMACSLENGQIRKHYGDVAYITIMFTMGMWSFVTIAGEASSNPCAHIIRYMQGKHSIKSLVLHVLCQLLGGLMSFSYARLFWYLELTDSHASRYRNLHCTTDLTVPAPIGFLLEFGATFIDVLLCLTTFTPFLFYEVATKSLLCCIVVILGVDLTGMYMNPINATNQTFGCRGINVFEHIFVYWLSVFLAAVLGVVTHTQLSQCWKIIGKEKDFHEDVLPIHGGKQEYSPSHELKDAKPVLDLNFKPNANSEVSDSNHVTDTDSEREDIEGEIFKKIENEIIKDEAVGVTEDVIFQTVESRYMKGESFDDFELSHSPLNLNEVARGQTEVSRGQIEDVMNANTILNDCGNKDRGLISDFEQEYEEVRRQERIHNFRNTTFDTVDFGENEDIMTNSTQTWGHCKKGAQQENIAKKSDTAPAVKNASLCARARYDSGGHCKMRLKPKNNGEMSGISPTIEVSPAPNEEPRETFSKDSSIPRRSSRSTSGSRIPVRAERKRSTSRSRIPVMKDGTKRRSRLKSE